MEIITTENFKEFMGSKTPVVLDLWAEWCGPCLTMNPVLSQIEQDLKGKVRIGKLNVDKEPTLAAMFKARGIPTFIMVKNGKEVHRVAGTQTKKGLKYQIMRSLELD